MWDDRAGIGEWAFHNYIIMLHFLKTLTFFVLTSLPLIGLSSVKRYAIRNCILKRQAYSLFF